MSGGTNLVVENIVIYLTFNKNQLLLGLELRHNRGPISSDYSKLEFNGDSTSVEVVLTLCYETFYLAGQFVKFRYKYNTVVD